MKDKRFEKIREGLYQELLKANLHFKVFWSIREASDDIAKATRVHRSFFYYTMWANSDRFCLAINNILKHYKNTYNFHKLFNYARSHPELSALFSEEEINEMEETINSHQDLIQRLRKVRDKYIAHKEIIPEHLKEEITYEQEEGKELLVDLNNILEKVSHKYDQTLYWRDNTDLLEVSPSLNVEDVLRSLTEHYVSQTKRSL
jgi:hypothetical protein